MFISLLLKGILAGWITSIPLGPVGVLCIQRTLKGGRTQGFISSLGATTADTIYAIIACLGVSIVTQFIQERQTIFQIISGSVIFIFGAAIFLKGMSSCPDDLKVENRVSYSIDFLSGFIFTISNPLTVFFFIAYFAGLNIYSEHTGASHAFVLILGILLGSASWFYTLSGMASYFREKIRDNMLHRINKWCGLVLLFAGTAIFIKLFLFA